MTEEGPQFEPTEFGPYVLVSPLGEGGMAEVFLAVREGPMGFRKELAIKRIRTDVTKGDDQLAKYLINEARLGGQLRHPNVVDVYEFGTVEDQHYIAMEFVHGLTLRALIKGAAARDVRLPLGPVLDLGQQVCEGLQYAHNASSPQGEPLGLIHRDLKPANIIVSMAGQAKIMDFGIARHASAMFQTTTEDLHKGTLRYMSPEQLDDPRGIDHRSDLFALGAILFEALTGEILLDGPDNRSVMWSIISGKYSERLKKLEETLPEARPVIERAMALDREARYPDADAFGDALRELRDELGLPTGCKDLMALIEALRESAERFDQVRDRIESRISRTPRETGWPMFVSSMQGQERDAADPYHHDTLPAVDLATLPSKIGSKKAEDLAPPPTTQPTRKMPAQPTEPDTAPPLTFSEPRRSVLPWVIVAVLVVGIGVGAAIWRPWQTRTDAGDAAALATENGTTDEGTSTDGTTNDGTTNEETSNDGTTNDGTTDVGTTDEGATDAGVAPPTPAEASPEPTPAPAETPTPAEEPATAAAAAADAPTVRVVINADPWASWRLSGDSEASGAHTPYIGYLRPGTYRFVLQEGGSGAIHEIPLTISGEEESVSRCWSFTKNGPC